MKIKIEREFGECIDMPSPTEEEQNSEIFNAIYDVIGKWDINVPEYYDGFCGGNGSHVKLILDVVRKSLRDEKINDLLDE